MDDKDPALNALLLAYEGRMKKEEIPNLQTRRIRIGAAYGYILRHRKEFLTDDLYVIGPYGHLLCNLTGDDKFDDDMLVNISRQAGLHVPLVPRGRFKVVLTPPGQLGIKSAIPQITRSDIAEAKKLVRQIRGKGSSITYAAYLELKKIFES